MSERNLYLVRIVQYKKVRNNEFYQRCMEKALADLEEPEEDDEDPFDL